MNKARRDTLNTVKEHLAKVVDEIGEALEWVQGVKDEEEEAKDAMPENMQQGEKFQTMEEAVGKLEVAVQDLEECKDKADEAGGLIDEALSL